MKGCGTYIQVIGTVIGNWFNWFMGDSDNLLYALITFVLLEYLSSIICAIKDKVLTKEVSLPSICEKVLIFAMVGVGHVLDSYVVGGSTVLRTTVSYFYIAVEGVTLLNNAVYLGLPIPQVLKSVFEQLLNKATGRNENTNNVSSKRHDESYHQYHGIKDKRSRSTKKNNPSEK